MAKAFLYLQTGLTFGKVKQGTELDGLNGFLAAVSAPAVAAGDPNPFWEYVQDLAVAGKVTRRNANDQLAEYGPIENINHLDFEPIGMLLAAGGEGLGIPVWFEVDELNYDDPVPESLPYSVALVDPLDPDAGTAPVTWRDWHDAHHHHAGPWSGKRYVAGNSMGSELDASVWWPIYDAPPAGVRVLSQAEFVAIADANQPQE